MLRKANIKDFKVYKELFEDKDFRYQWLYYYPLLRTEACEEDKEAEDWMYDDIMEYYHNYSVEMFEKELKTSKIFMIEKEGKVLGCVRALYCGKGKYKLCEWGMFRNDPIVKAEVIEELKSKLPKLKKINVCTDHKPARDFLISQGFVQTGKFFLELKVC